MITMAGGPVSGMVRCETCAGVGAGLWKCLATRHNQFAPFLGAPKLDVGEPAVRAFISWATRVTQFSCPDCGGLGFRPGA